MINEASLALIKEFEGLRLEAYKCPAGRWTIGYGHTGPDVHAGMRITEARAEALLTKDLMTSEAYVKRVVSTALNANQFGALVSLAFNVGSFGDELRAALNAYNLAQATKVWARYCNVNGQPSRGLKLRRAAEIALFNVPVKP